MRSKLTIALFLLNLIAFGAIFFLERAGEDEPAGRQPEPILPSSITQSDRIEVSGEAVPQRRVLVREGESWRLEEPVVWRANPNAIDRIFRALLFLRQDIRFTMEDVERNNQSLADYGLETPVLRLAFVRNGESTVVSVGSPTDVGGRFYLLGPDGGEIFVVDEEVLRSVALDLQDLRARNLFALDFFAIKEMTLQPGNGRNLQIRLAAVEDGWRFEAPIQTRASAPAVDARLQAILETPVLDLIPESQIPPSESGLVEPRLRLSLDDGTRRRTFLLGKPVPDREGEAYGKLEGVPTVAIVPEEPFLALEDAQRKLRERSFFLFRLPEVSTLRIASPARRVSLQKLEDQSWQVTAEGEDLEPVRYPADPGVLARTFESLITLRASRFVSDAPSDSDLAAFGLVEPQRRVEVVGAETRELLLGNLDPETKTVFAKITGEPFVYAVPLEIIRELSVSPLSYRLRVLDRLPEAARVRSVKVEDLESGELLIERTLGADGQSWAAPAGESAEPDMDAAFAVLLQQIRTFRVASYLSPSFTDGLRLEENRVIPWRFRLVATITLPASGGQTEETREYVFTKRIGGTLQGGGSAAGGVTFVLPQELIDAWALLFPERPLPEIYAEEEAAAAAEADEATETETENPAGNGADAASGAKAAEEPAAAGGEAAQAGEGEDRSGGE